MSYQYSHILVPLIESRKIACDCKVLKKHINKFFTFISINRCPPIDISIGIFPVETDANKIDSIICNNVQKFSNLICRCVFSLYSPTDMMQTTKGDRKPTPGFQNSCNFVNPKFCYIGSVMRPNRYSCYAIKKTTFKIQRGLLLMSLN